MLEELQQTNSGEGLDSKRVRSVVFQILCSIEHLHKNNIMHRDVKPENLLISKNKIVKLCDFGFARGIKQNQNFMYTEYVSTRWYRAPELLIGDA